MQTEGTWETPLDELASSLRSLHRALVDVAKRDFVPVSGPFEMLSALMTHPHFAWLRQLSEFLVELDAARTGAEVPDEAAVRALRSALESLIGPAPASSAEFRDRYLAAVQDDPKVASLHGEVRTRLGRLPQPRGA